MAIDSAYKTIQHEVGQDALHDVVEQCKFGRLPSRPVGTDKDVKYEERPCGCEASCDESHRKIVPICRLGVIHKTPLVRRPMNKTPFRHVAG